MLWCVIRTCTTDGIIEMLEDEDAENVKKQVQSTPIINVEDQGEEENQTSSGHRKERNSGSDSTRASGVTMRPDTRLTIFFTRTTQWIRDV